MIQRDHMFGALRSRTYIEAEIKSMESLELTKILSYIRVKC